MGTKAACYGKETKLSKLATSVLQEFRGSFFISRCLQLIRTFTLIPLLRRGNPGRTFIYARENDATVRVSLNLPTVFRLYF